MKNGKLEHTIEDDFVEKTEAQGYPCVKMDIEGHRNWPDRQIFTGNGYSFFIEFKRTAEDKPRKGQQIRHQILRSLGYNVYVCWDIKTALGILAYEVNFNGQKEKPFSKIIPA